MELHIVTPFEKKNYTISWLELDTPTGNFVIQPGHAPMILVAQPGKRILFTLSDGKQEVIMANRAIVEITRTVITIVVSE